jgi:hypothetical protein
MIAGAAIADHDEVRGAHACVAELGSGQRQHGDCVLDREFALEVNEGLVDGKLGTAAEYEAILSGIPVPGAFAPRLVAGRLPGALSCLCAPVSSDGRQRRDGPLDLQGLDVLAAVMREHRAQGRPYAVLGFGGELRCERGLP